MNLRAYYRKIREVEDAIPDDYVVVMSQETPDGGRANVGSEVSRHMAAKMIVEGRARLASTDEEKTFLDTLSEARTRAAEEAMAKKVQIAIVQEPQRTTKKPAAKQ